MPEILLFSPYLGRIDFFSRRMREAGTTDAAEPELS